MNNANGVRISELHLDKVCKFKRISHTKKPIVNSQKEKNTDILNEPLKKIKTYKKQKIKDHFNLDDLPPPTITTSPLISPDKKSTVLIPSHPDNYLEIQRNIRNSNPILWLIRNKNLHNQIKDKIQIENMIKSSSSYKQQKERNNITPIIPYRPNLPLPKLQIENADKKEIKLISNDTSDNKDGKIYGNSIHWKKGDLIHDGEHSLIYKAFNITTGNVFIVKEYKSEHFLNKKYFYNEIKILKIVHHCNIVNFLGGEVCNNKQYIYLDYVPGGSINEFVLKFGSFRETVIKNYIKQIISVFEYLTAQGLIFANLSLNHLLIDADGLIKFIDFSNVQNKKNIYKNKKFELRVNYDLKSLGKVLNELIELCETTSHITYSKMLINYCEFLNGNEINLISFREIKNHPFLK